MARAVLALSFGKGKKGRSTNEANARIAEFADALAMGLFDATLIIDASVPTRTKGAVLIGSDSKDSHDSTIELIEKAFYTFPELRIKEVWLITARPYLQRALHDAKEVFGPTIKVHGVILDGEWFFSDSSQPWTTSWWRWWPREIILRAMPFKLYAWITKKLA